MGGSTSGGITSGLKRARYVEGQRVTTEDVLKEYGPPPRSSNVYDFLIDFGLNIASMPPQGNIISTAAGAAREPFSRFTEGKSKGDQLAYAMRAQAADTARKQNLAYDEMKMKREIAEMNLSSHKKFGVMSPRPEYELKQTDVLKDNKNIWDKMFSKNRGKWEGSVYYDNSQHKKGNIINAADSGKIIQKDQEFLVDLTKFKEGDENNIFWDDTTGEWFTVTFNEKDNKWEIDKSMAMVISDETENYTDFSLKELQNYLENKKSADIIQSGGDETNENDLTSLVVENKLDESMVHPTVDGTATGEISEAYIQEYADKNKIVFNEEEWKKKGGNYGEYELTTLTQLKRKLETENRTQAYTTERKKEGEKRTKRKAFIWFNMNLEKFEAGIIKRMPESYAPYLEEYKNADKKGRLKIIRSWDKSEKKENE